MERNLVFPKLNKDKFSITPAEPTVGDILIKFCNLPEDASDCSTNSTIIANEKFWVSFLYISIKLGVSNFLS